MVTPATELLEQLPDAETIRARLSQTVRDAALLRKMLRLAQQRERDLQEPATAEASS